MIVAATENDGRNSAFASDGMFLIRFQEDQEPLVELSFFLLLLLRFPVPLPRSAVPSSGRLPPPGVTGSPGVSRCRFPGSVFPLFLLVGSAA